MAVSGSLRPALLRPALIGLAIGVGAALLASFGGQVGFLRAFELATYDWRVRRSAEPAPATSPIAIVEINESSIRELAPVVGRWPWPRLVHASAISYLTRAGAKVIAYDVLFGEREGNREAVVNGLRIVGDDSDRLFIDAVRDAGNVVLLADATFEGLATG